MSKNILKKLPKSQKAIFIFRRDLRIEDNTALFEAMKDFSVSPVFIFSPEQIKDNPYKSNNAVQFMVNSLRELSRAIEESGGQLRFFYGEPLNVITSLLEQKNKYSALFINRDYSPYSTDRDSKIEKLCQKNDITFKSFNDHLLIGDLDRIKSNDGANYYLFTHFYKKSVKLEIEKVRKRVPLNWGEGIGGEEFEVDFEDFVAQSNLFPINEKIVLKGGREEGMNLLLKASQKKDYQKTRNTPAISNGTSNLSAHLRFGTLGIREVFWRFKLGLGIDSELIKQLFWRDFYIYLSHHFPQTNSGKPIPSKERFGSIKWEDNEIFLKRWKEGNTGFPIVDAGMRELVETGLMHNRLRMVTAMFLTKDLLIDWREGEKFFSQHLLDIDRPINQGNWMWCVGNGADGSPWLRIFNPESQAQKIDPECEYIKKWCPELKEVPNKSVLNWEKEHKKYSYINYPEPLIVLAKLHINLR